MTFSEHGEFCTTQQLTSVGSVPLLDLMCDSCALLIIPGLVGSDSVCHLEFGEPQPLVICGDVCAMQATLDKYTAALARDSPIICIFVNDNCDAEVL